MRATHWLETYTHRSAAWWIAAIQECIRKKSKPSEDPNHSQNDPKKFLSDVADLVVTTLPKEGKYDGNMRVAAIMGLVLCLWKSRLHYAKTQAPLRPIEGRQASYEQWMTWAETMVSAIFDEREDTTYFPGQEWDNPYSIDAKDGDFV